MKKLILILVIVFPFLANGQDYRVVDWKTDVLNVQTVGIDTFKFDAEPKDYNDAGAITREIGNYFIDHVARCFKIIDSDANTITVVDLEHINLAPQSNKIGRIYQSVVDADTLFQSIGGVDISVLDQMSIYRDVARNNEIICRVLKELSDKDSLFVKYSGNDRDVDLRGNSISADTFKVDGVPLLQNTFKQGNLGGAGDIFYSTGASSQPASGSVTDVVGDNYIKNQNTGAQNANVWISGDITNGGITTHIRNGLTSTSQILFKTNTTFDWFLGQSPLGASSNDLALFSYGMGDIIANFNKETSVSTFGTANVGYFGHHLITKSYYGSGIKFINGKTDNADIRNFSIQSDNFEYGDLAISKSTNQGGVTDVNLLYFANNRSASFISTIQATTAKLTNLTDGYFPIHKNDTDGLVNSNIYQDGSGNVGISKTDPSERLDVNGNAIADVLKSRVTTGTAPLVVASTTKVDSLNVGLLDGKHASDFQLKSDTLTFDATLSDLNDSTAAIRALANTKASISGTDNFIMKKTGANTLGNSLARSNNTGIGIGVDANRTLHIGASGQPTFAFTDTRGGIDQQEMGFLYDAGLALTRPGMVFQKLGNDGSFSRNLFTFFQNGTINFDGIEYPDSNVVVFGTKKIGLGTTTPAARMHSQSTTTQLRLGYDATKYTDLSTGSTGNLTIDPTGDTTNVAGAVNSTGGFFKNGVEITGGGGMVYPPAGIPVSTGTGWATSGNVGFDNWNLAYNDKINAIAFSGTSTKTLTLTQQDGGTLTASFTDLSSGGSMTWPAAPGIAVYSGSSSWSTSKTAPSGAIVGTTDSQALTNKSVNGVTLSTGEGNNKILFGDGTYKIINGVQSLTSASSITMNFATAPKASLSLATNGTISITNVPDGGEGSIEVTSSGAYTLAIAGSTGYTSTQKMGTVSAIASSAHTTVFYWRSGTVLYYGFLLNN